jgi:hypothetical protein
MAKPKKKDPAPNPWLYACPPGVTTASIVAALCASRRSWVAEVDTLSPACVTEEGAFFTVVHALGYKDPRRVRQEDLRGPLGYAGFLFYTPFDLARRCEEQLDDDEVIILRNSATFGASRLAKLIHRLMGGGLERLATRVPRGTLVYDLAGRPPTTRSFVLDGWEQPTLEAHGLGERLALQVNALPSVPASTEQGDAQA